MPDMILSHQPRTLCEYFSQWDDFEGTVWYDEFDAAFVGFGWQFNVGPVVVYDQERVMEILVADGYGDSEDPEMDALEHFNFNVIGGYVGERTPIFLTHVGDKAVEDFLKRKAGAEISGWSVDISAEGVTEIS
jgi:hypothetical protein